MRGVEFILSQSRSNEEVVVTSKTRKTPWFLWPFEMLWRLASGILELTGRVIAIGLGIGFIAVGTLLSLTVIGAILGVPLALFGFLLLLRGIF
jgi:hypothetical protein